MALNATLLATSLVLAVVLSASEHSAPTANTVDDEDALPFDRVEVSEVVASPAPSPEPEPDPYDQIMSPVGVDDPFPDRPPRARPRDAGLLLGLGLGLGAGSLILARLSLLPECGNRADVTTCLVPDGNDIGMRGGRLVGAVAFGIGGAVFGALGGRALGQALQHGPAARLERRGRIAVGVGSLAVTLGVFGFVAGVTIFGVRARRAVGIARTYDPAAPDVAAGNKMLDQLKLARGGLMALVASPTLVAAGIALLIHRPRPARSWALRPQLSPHRAGLSLASRF